MLYIAPATGKTHSTGVNHDLCTFIRNNAKVGFRNATGLPVADYEPGSDCVNCASAIAEEIAKATEGNPQDLGDARQLNTVTEINDVDDDWEDEDEYVVDPEKKAAVERERGLMDAEKAIENYEHLATEGRFSAAWFWREKAAELRAAIEYIPESAKVDPAPEEPEPSEDAETDLEMSEQQALIEAPEEDVKPVKKAPARRKSPMKKEPAS
ncbi:hypothetical protein AB0B15_17150 [Streptomyces sp. NPDC045456]|uniref:hypothetical protein n=1 Tax=Streptomyces sp. NPDC045456 TaxID=3155254 RepID=UPI0033F2032B